MRRVLVFAAVVLLLVPLVAFQGSVVAIGQAQSPTLPLVVTKADSSHGTTSSSDPSTDYFTLYINQYGINDSSGNVNMTATQGDTVVITFIWNDSEVAYNSHQMRVEGYDVTSTVVSAYSTTSTVTFVADIAGTFQVHCIIPCLGMANMQDGWLNVAPSGQSSSTTSTSSSATSSTSSSASSGSSTSTTSSVSTSTATHTTATPTNTTLNVLSSSITNGVLFAKVSLVDSNGNPVVDVQLQFSLQTDFGKVSLGSNQTLANGTTSFTYTMPSVWEGPLYISFSGTKAYSPSYATANISARATTTSGPPYVNGQEQSPDLRLIGVPPLTAGVVVGLFLTVLVCVYGVMIFVLVRVVRIGRRTSLGK